MTHADRGRKIRVLLVDDHEEIRKALILLFEMQPDIEIIGEASSGKKAIQKAMELIPDVILMDVNMLQTNGIEASQTISSRLPESRIIGMSIDDSQSTVETILKAGASAFLSKDSSSEEILKVIRRFGSNN